MSYQPTQALVRALHPSPFTPSDYFTTHISKGHVLHAPFSGKSRLHDAQAAQQLKRAAKEPLFASILGRRCAFWRTNTPHRALSQRGRSMTPVGGHSHSIHAPHVSTPCIPPTTKKGGRQVLWKFTTFEPAYEHRSVCAKR